MKMLCLYQVFNMFIDISFI